MFDTHPFVIALHALESAWVDKEKIKLTLIKNKAIKPK
jgi:hypothetical protein